MVDNNPEVLAGKLEAIAREMRNATAYGMSWISASEADNFTARIDRVALALRAPPATKPDEKGDFQLGVDRWMDQCFGEPIKSDQLERADRFTEEALELAQTMPGFTADRAHALVDYVFARPVGERGQEVGGVMVCLAALCNTAGLRVDVEADRELARIWTKVEAIRAKQAAKPTGSALPVANASPGIREAVLEGFTEQIVVDALLRAMNRADITSRALAKELGVSEARVCQMLRTGSNMTLQTVKKTFAAIRALTPPTTGENEGEKAPCEHEWRYVGTDYHGSHKGEDSYKCAKPGCNAHEYRP